MENWTKISCFFIMLLNKLLGVTMQFTVIKVLISVFVFIHIVENLWHSDANATLEITLLGAKTAFVVVILIGSILGAVLTWRQYLIIGSWLKS